jgi:hypothetical protein
MAAGGLLGERDREIRELRVALENRPGDGKSWWRRLLGKD